MTHEEMLEVALRRADEQVERLRAEVGRLRFALEAIARTDDRAMNVWPGFRTTYHALCMATLARTTLGVDEVDGHCWDCGGSGWDMGRHCGTCKGQRSE
jgi:hypothetical protein